MKTRVISGAVLAVLLILIVLLGAWTLRIALALVSMLMVTELFRAVRLRSILLVPAAILAAVLAMDIIPADYLGTVLCLYLILCLGVFLWMHNKLHIHHAALGVLFPFFIGLFLGCITKIRMLPDGAYWVWLVFVGAWVCDVFAYFTGSFFGRTKLLPEVSPKKTVEGAVGGALGAGIGFLVFSILVGTKIGNVHPVGLFFAGIFTAVSGQVGDLVASAIKRQYGIKDYGKIMPGHGGAMDRFDSVLFVAPIMYFYLQLVL